MNFRDFYRQRCNKLGCLVTMHRDTLSGDTIIAHDVTGYRIPSIIAKMPRYGYTAYDFDLINDFVSVCHQALQRERIEDIKENGIKACRT